MPIVEDLVQRSPEWIQQRIGCCTASRLNDVMAKLKTRPTGEAAVRANYKKQLAIERLTNRATDHYVNDAMLHGIDTEPIARAEYEMLTDSEVEIVGLASHPSINWFSASPDGLIGREGMLEIKCLSTINHLDILISGNIPEEYHWQMLGGMACAERQFCDFVSFDPRMPEGLRIFVKRLERNDALIRGMELEVMQFLGEVEKLQRDLEILRRKVMVTA